MRALFNALIHKGFMIIRYLIDVFVIQLLFYPSQDAAIETGAVVPCTETLSVYVPDEGNVKFQEP